MSTFSNFWNSCEEDFTRQWINLAEQLNQQLFEVKTDETIATSDIVRDFSNLFEQMNDDVNSNNRRSYCKVLFEYCELTQDWQNWGEWAETEISIGAGSDAPWLYYGLGRYLEEIGQLKKSIDYHQSGIAASQQTGDSLFLACNHLGAGIALQRYDKPKDAESHLIQALELFKAQSKTPLYLQAQTLVNLGSYYDRVSQGNDAIKCYQESAQILQRIGNYFDLGRILYSLGIAYLNLNQLIEAEQVFLEAKQLCIDNNNLYVLALNLYGIGWLEYKKGNFEDSQNYLEESIRQFKQVTKSGLEAVQLSFPEIEGNIYLVACAAYSKGSKPNFEAAEKYLEQAEKSYRRLDYAEVKLLNVLANRARIYEYSERWSAAISAFSELLVEGKRLNSTRIIADAAVHLTRIYQKKPASFTEWVGLIQKLGLSGISILAKKYFR